MTMTTGVLQEPLSGRIPLGPTLEVLLTELGEECEHLLGLFAQLRREDLRREQREDLLAELTAAVLHVHVHTEGLDDVISDEMEKL